MHGAAVRGVGFRLEGVGLFGVWGLGHGLGFRVLGTVPRLTISNPSRLPCRLTPSARNSTWRVKGQGTSQARL